MGQTQGKALDAGAAAGLCLCAAVLLYHIPLGDSVAADALHACLTAGAALACLAACRKTRGASLGAGEATKPADRCDGAARGTSACPAGTEAPAGATGRPADDRPAVVSGAAGRPGRPCRRAVSTLAALCLLGAVAGVACASWAAGGALGGSAHPEPSPASAWLPMAATLLASCAGTAVWEEALFRRLLPEAVERALDTPGSRRLQAACISAALFAMLHLGAAPGGLSWALRAVQVSCFALAMAGTVAASGRLAPAVAAHALYDLVCFAPAALGLPAGASAWDVSAQTLAALETDVAGMAASLVFLVPAALMAIWKLRR